MPASNDQQERQGPIPIRNLNRAIYHRARMAALKAKVSVGVWISRAILERLNREKGL